MKITIYDDKIVGLFFLFLVLFSVVIIMFSCSILSASSILQPSLAKETDNNKPGPEGALRNPNEILIPSVFLF